MLGIVDVAVIGHFGSTSDLAALGVASLIFSFVYWAFGFLRMSTTGLVAQAEGKGDPDALRLLVVRSILLAISLAIALWLVQAPLQKIAIYLLAPPDTVAQLAKAYFDIRIWSAPASLTIFVVGGVLIGQSRSRTLLLMHLFLYGSNMVFDLLFAGLWGWGVKGVAIGTLLAEWMTALIALAFLASRLGLFSTFRKLNLALLRAGSGSLLGKNRDIFIRTLFMLLGFGFFTHMSGQFGEENLAANYLLLQLISFSAFFLDGFAYVVESIIGKAVGKKDYEQFWDAVKKSSQLAILTALVLASVVLFFGTAIVELMTNKTMVQLLAKQYLPLVSLYIALAVAAFQLDGIFIGATYASAMRNCSVISFIVFIALWYSSLHRFENEGLWWSFIAFVVARSVTLSLYYPSLVKSHFER